MPPTKLYLASPVQRAAGCLGLDLDAVSAPLSLRATGEGLRRGARHAGAASVLRVAWRCARPANVSAARCLALAAD